jgi:NADH:ubiquinone oxidoreductase subunit 5 (subunit L)/multisubunit Na+/H+ antiporter MnhA subunit
MEGPTPVSALMHAATLVTAGTVLLIKCSGLFYNLLFWVFVVGFINSLYSGISAIVESDFKSIVAYSTSSQIGFSFILIGLGEIKQAYFYITIHAIFKSLLFWSVGLVGHTYRSQYASGLVSRNMLFIANTGLVMAGWSLIGFPFVSGFYSKESMLSVSLLNFHSGLLIAFLTIQIISIIYTIRLLLLLSGKLAAVVSNSRLKLNLTKVMALFPIVLSSLLSVFFALNLLTISRALGIETIFGSYGGMWGFNFSFLNFTGGWFVVFVMTLFILSQCPTILSHSFRAVVNMLYVGFSVIFISCLLFVMLLFFVVIGSIPFLHLCLFSIFDWIKRRS